MQATPIFLNGQLIGPKTDSGLHSCMSSKIITGTRSHYTCLKTDLLAINSKHAGEQVSRSCSKVGL